MPTGIDETFTIRLLAHPVNAEMRSSFVGHHISATFELRAGVVKAEARGVERSESLDERRAQLDADDLMADATSTETEVSFESAVRSMSDLRQVRNNNALGNGAQIIRGFDGGLRHRHRA